MENEKTGELVLEGLLIAENNDLVGQDGTHVSAEGFHILGNEDSLLLGLIPEGIKAVTEGDHQVLEIGARLDGASAEVGLRRWSVCRGLPSVTLGSPGSPK